MHSTGRLKTEHFSPLIELHNFSDVLLCLTKGTSFVTDFGTLIENKKKEERKKDVNAVFFKYSMTFVCLSLFFLLLSKPVTNIMVSASNILNNRIFTKKTMNQQKADQVEY